MMRPTHVHDVKRSRRLASPFRFPFPHARALATSLLLAAPFVSADDGEAILERSIEAHGGLARFRGLESWHVVAERNTRRGGEVYDEYVLRDDGKLKTLLVKTQPDAVLVYGHDGARGFALTNGDVRTDDAAEAEGYYRAHGEYYLRALPFKWRDPGMTVTHLGEETLDGRSLDLLRIAADEGTGRAWSDVWVAAIDRSTHLLYEARLTHYRQETIEAGSTTQPNSPTEITYRYTDYRDVGGLKLSFRMEYFSGGEKTGENLVENITVDPDLPSELFSPAHHRR